MKIIMNHYLKTVSGGSDPKPAVSPSPSMPNGQIAIGSFNILPNIAGNEHNAAANIVISTPLTNNVNIYAGTTVITDYHNYHNPINTIGFSYIFP
ncbi:MAG: hypothetical protein AB7D28_11345 [Candidatus Berkiella sp.]